MNERLQQVIATVRENLQPEPRAEFNEMVEKANAYDRISSLKSSTITIERKQSVTGEVVTSFSGRSTYGTTFDIEGSKTLAFLSYFLSNHEDEQDRLIKLEEQRKVQAAQLQSMNTQVMDFAPVPEEAEIPKASMTYESLALQSRKLL